MKIKEDRVTATIPTTQYGNIIPSVSVEDVSSLEEASSVLFPYIEGVWKQNGERPLTKKSELEGEPYVELETFTGEVVRFYESNHTYTDVEGNQLLSGSRFQKKFSHEFNADKILPACSKSWGVEEKDIKDIWKMNSDISLHFGNMIHIAMELYFKHKITGESIQQKKKGQEINYVIHNHPVIAGIMSEFIEKFGKKHGDSLTEVVVSSVENKMVGMVDKLLITSNDKKECWVEDYKTNFGINDKGKGSKYLKEPFDNIENTKLNGYWLQLSFYANILQKHGWTVKGLRIYNYETEWKEYEHEVIDLSKLNK